MKNLTKFSFTTLTAVTLALQLSSAPFTAQAAQTDAVSHHDQEEISTFTTAGRVGTTTSRGELRTNPNWSNVNNPGWEVPNGSRVIHQGQRVFCGDSRGWFERVSVQIAPQTSVGWFHSDHIRW